MKHLGFADAVNTSAMQLVGKSLVDFLGVWPELEALSLALISFSTIFSDPLRFHSSSFTCQLTSVATTVVIFSVELRLIYNLL